MPPPTEAELLARLIVASADSQAERASWLALEDANAQTPGAEVMKAMAFLDYIDARLLTLRADILFHRTSLT